MAVTNISLTELDGLHITGGAAGSGTTDTVWAIAPDCKEAIIILEEAEYELKEVLKKTPDTIHIGPKGPQDLVNEALRDVQKAIRALLKTGG